ncbi:MAG: hypothetical protein ACOYVF_12670 [Candidatus Zixiibacteriota bacterium]
MLKKIIIPIIFVFVTGVPLAAQDNDALYHSSPAGRCFDGPMPPCLAQVDEPDSFNSPDNQMRFSKARKHYFEAQEQQRKHLEQLRMLKLLELLDLSDEQELQFLTSFRSMRRATFELQREKMNLVDTLVEAVSAEKIDDGKINQAIDDIMRLEQERNRVMESFIDEVRGFLNVEQLGKLLIFQEKFEIELLENLKNFQSRKGRNP